MSISRNLSGISICILGHAIAETLRISIPAVWHARRGSLTKKICDESLNAWSERLIKRARINLVVDGQEHLLSQNPPYIVISNHQSLYDIPILFQALPFSLRMAAKKELFGVPIWGRAMKVAGFIEIDRKDRNRAYSALKTAEEQMRVGPMSLLIAPEGTRTKTGELLPFRNGAFNISRLMGLPLLPVAIDGAFQVHRSGEWAVHQDQTVQVHILPPLLPEHFDTSEAFRDTGRAMIQASLSGGSQT